MIADAAQNRDWVPLTNFTLCNLMAEGMLLGKQMFPDELRPFPFDEQQYLRSTMKELSSRRAMGVDVGPEIAGAPGLREKVSSAEGGVAGAGEERPDRSRFGDPKAGQDAGPESHPDQRLDAFKEVQEDQARPGQVRLHGSGGDFGFDDAVGCASFISRVTSPVNI